MLSYINLAAVAVLSTIVVFTSIELFNLRSEHAKLLEITHQCQDQVILVPDANIKEN